MPTYGFELVHEAEIPELNTRAKLYRYVKTGTILLSLENQDENKSFGVAFRTPVTNSTGVTHILEHSVLGGSARYPVKEPFVELIKGSLKTFINAFTYPDRTVYPVASTNRQDFYNLVDVYLDAVFHPLLTPEHLQQEGWHYEIGENGALEFSGIVFNEMKGAYSVPERRLNAAAEQALFPDTNYFHESGGNPTHIPELTYEQFKNYYQRYYHPSNAFISFSGDDPPEERLRRIDAFLSAYEKNALDSSVPLQPRFGAPRRVEAAYPIGPEVNPEKKGMVAIGWLLDEVTDQENVFAWNVLDHLLVGTQAAPLRRALIDSGLGEDLVATGLEEGLRQMVFSVGLKGVAPGDAERVEAITLQTLGELGQKGFDPELVEGALNTLEFRLREFNTGGFPRGLSMILTAIQGWMYGIDPIEALAFEKPLRALKARLDAGEAVFTAMIRKDLVENPHRVSVVLRPNQQLAAQEEAEEKQRLVEIQKKMTPEQIEGVKETARRLHERQEAPDTAEALATIPRLTLADLDKQVKTIPVEIQQREGVPVLFHDLPTNGITYLDVGFDLHRLPGGLLPYIPLFGRALIEMGTTQEDFLSLSRRIGRETGGVRPDTYLSTVVDTRQTTAWLFLRGKAMTDKTDRLLEILRDTINLVKLDNRDRFKQMVLEHKARLESALIPGGNGFVRSRLGAHYGEVGWVGDQLGGFGQLFFVRQLARLVDEDWPFMLHSLEEIRSRLLNRGAAIANVTAEQKNWERLAPRFDLFLAELFRGESASVEWTREAYPPNEGLTLPATVNYVGKAANLFDLGFSLDGADEVVTRYLTRTWLWDQVRVKGGAYGVGAGLDRRSGLLAYTSYRDPHLLETLQVYDESARFLRNLKLDQDELTKAIIGTISDMDPHLLPDAKGWVSLDRYLAHVTDADRQKLRDEVLGTTSADFNAFAQILDAVNQKGDVVVLGGPSAVDTANQERGGKWLTVTNVGL